MKKIIAIILITLMIFGNVACTLEDKLPDTDSEQSTQKITETEKNTESKLETETDTETEIETESATESDTATDTETETTADTETYTETETNTDTETDTETETVTDTEAETETENETESESNTETETEANTETETETNAETGNTSDNDEKSIKILAIGNSFSVDAMEYLWNVFKDGGYDTVELGNLYIGGCSLNTHWSNIQNNSSSYTFYKNYSGTWSSTTSSIASALRSNDWDIVTIQQSSDSSGKTSTFTNLNNIVEYIDRIASDDTKILWHMTWAYQSNSTHQAFPNYSSNQMTMYNAIINAVNEKVLTNTHIDGVIPSGTTIQNLRTSNLGDTLTRDGYHLSYSYGRYAAALTWYAYITGADIEDIDWIPNSYPQVNTQLENIKESVRNAITTPYAVTNSTYTTAVSPSDAALFSANGLNISNYRAISLNITTNTFYDSRLGFDLRPSTHELAPKYSATAIFSKYDLPEGTVIIVDSGYQYRPDGWIDANTLTESSARPGNVSANFTVVNNAWWKDFTLRGFNLSKTNGSTMTSDDSVHLRIYVPKN